MSIALPELPSADAGAHIPRSPDPTWISKGATPHGLLYLHEVRDFHGSKLYSTSPLGQKVYGRAFQTARKLDAHPHAFGLEYMVMAAVQDALCELEDAYVAARDMGSRVAAPVDQQPRDRPNTPPSPSEEKEETR